MFCCKRSYAVATAFGVMFILAATTAVAGSLKNPDEIIRSLAPLSYLSTHSANTANPSIDLTIPFALNSARLKPDARAQLQALGKALGSRELSNSTIQIAGHTDATGKAGFNQKLSERRASTIKEFLVKTFGFDAHRFHIIGYGEERLKAPLTPHAAINRRVEISILGGLGKGQTESKNLDQAPLDESGQIKW